MAKPFLEMVLNAHKSVLVVEAVVVKARENLRPLVEAWEKEPPKTRRKKYGPLAEVVATLAVYGGSLHDASTQAEKLSKALVDLAAWVRRGAAAPVT